MKKNLLVSIWFLVGLWTFCQAQEQTASSSEEEAFSGSDRYTSSPQTWSSMKYGGSTPNLYTGTVSASIPIYTYKDDDFTLPLSLNYASNGYMPNVQANYVGLDWFVNAGGCISQTVRGVPDMRDGIIPSGYLLYEKNDATCDSVILDPSGILLKYSCYAFKQRNLSIETEPDIFTFNFPGHSGSFMFAGKQVYFFNTNHPQGEYSIQLDSRAALGGAYCLIITTGDGYQYEFELMNLAPVQTVGINDWQPLRFEGNGASQTWYLIKVIAPNKRFISLEYNQSDLSNYRPDGVTIRQSPIDKPTVPNLSFEQIPQKVYSLKKINIDNHVDVEFMYGARDSEYYRKGSNGSSYSLSTPDKLDSIRITKFVDLHTRKTLKECVLEYTYSPSSENKVLFLSSVKVSGEGTYQMQYYHNLMNPKFPYQGTFDIDYWGYYNAGSNGDITTPPVVSLETTYFSEVHMEGVEQARKPDSWRAKQGMLTKLTYPMGGYTTFEYEPHTYRDVVTRDRTSDNMPYLKPESADREAGGLRIKKITNHPVDGEPTSKTYIYTKDGKSTGNLLVKPYCYFYMKEYEKGTDILKRTLTAWFTKALAGFRSNETHIEYESVTEKYDDGSYVTYDFANYHDSPDTFRSRRDTLENGQVTVDNSLLVNNFLVEPDFEPQFRGTLLCSSCYNSAGALVSETTFDYNKGQPRKYVESVKYAADYFYVQRSFLESFPLTGTTTKEYGSGGGGIPLTTQNTYEYNSLGQVSRKLKIESDGIKTASSITYVSDIPAAERTTTQQNMVKLNVLNLPISTEKNIVKYLTNGIGLPGLIEVLTLTGTEKYEYTMLTDSIIRLKWRDVAKITEPQTETTTLSYYRPVTYDKYDNKGRLLQKTDQTGLTTSYIWGYGGLYPVAVVVGTNLERLRPLMGAYYMVTQTGALPTACEQIRTLPNVLMTTYEYDSHIGVTKIKDPTGRIKSFRYDTDGRLVGEYDELNRAIRTYNYSIHNQ